TAMTPAPPAKPDLEIPVSSTPTMASPQNNGLDINKVSQGNTISSVVFILLAFMACVVISKIMTLKAIVLR
ncbi:MAG: hypothetical protein ACI8RO_002266, partial [Flavobacteriales bacterium]